MNVMKKTILNIIVVTTLLIALSGSLIAQTCTINGYVKDGPLGIPRAGANISIQGTSIGTTANSSGFYSILNAPTGSVTISASLVGYSNSTRTLITSSGMTYRVDFWSDAVTDLDGNSYSGVEIGTQVWTGENLKTTRYNNKTSIPLVTDNTAWSNLTTPGYCYYNNDIANYDTYGALYNWYTVNTGLLCPDGWHVPTDAEWITLVNYLGGQLVAGGKLKEAGTDHWTSPNTAATDESGFSALPGGYRVNTGSFSNNGNDIGLKGLWWSATEDSPGVARNRIMYYDNAYAYINYSVKTYGSSIRCLKNGLPSATISGTTAVCQNATSPIITFTGANGTAPYTFTYNINGGSNLTVTTTTGNSVTVAAPTNADGTFTYSLVSVQDAYTTVSQTGTAVVTVNPLPTANAGAALSAICQGGTSAALGGSVGGSATGGIWSTPAGGTFNPNETTLNATWTPPPGYFGTATLTLTTTGGSCGTASASKTQVVNPSPTVNAGAALSAICQGSTSAALGGSVGGSATGGIWSTPAGETFNPNETTLNATWTPPPGYFGTATLTLTTTGGSCGTASASKTQVVNPLPTATISGTASVCEDSESPNITFTGANGTAPYTFTYRINSGTDLTVATTSGNSVAVSVPTAIPDKYTYTLVSVRDESSTACSQTQSGSAVVTVNALPNVTFTGTLTAQCVSSTTYLLSGGLPAGGTYSGPGVTETNFNASVAGVGTHTITYTYADGNGCTNTATNSIVVNALPIVTFTGTLTAQCVSSTTYLLSGGLPAGGTYSGPGVTETNFNASVAGVGTHTITYTYADGNGCTNSITKTITVNPLPTANISGPTAITNVLCFGTSTGALDLTVTGGTPSYSFLWNNDATTEDLINIPAGDYSVTVTDANECQTSANAVVTQPPALDITINFVTNVTCTECSDGAIYITVSGGIPDYSYSWSGPGEYTSPDEDPGSLGAGVYQVIVTDANGCTETITAEVINPLMVTNTDDEGMGSLRNAINYANENNHEITDLIIFNISGTGPFTIQPLSPLPPISDQVVIDGYTQRYARPNSNEPGQEINSVLMIELNGTNASAGANGLTIESDNCVIRGLVINRFSHAGIKIAGYDNNIIEGNFIGTNVNGTAPSGNNLGVAIDGSGNYVGGINPSSRNLISGNNIGILLGAYSLINYVQGNFIGTDISGNDPLPNLYQGINSDGGQENVIGGTSTGARNIISGNNGDGIYLNIFDDGDPGTNDAETGSGNIVQGNFIGLKASGNEALGNGIDGIRVNSRDNIIGGSETGERNVVSANGGDGIHIWLQDATGNNIMGNLIGTDVSGTTDLGNVNAGIRLNTCISNIVGGVVEGSRNIISGNGAGIIIQGPGNVPEPRLNRIIGNYIGTDISGTSPVNNNDGIFISAANNNKVGGSMPGERNVISGNERFGIILIDDASNNEVKGNYIGTNADGTAPLPNATGIHILGGQNNIIGGAEAGEGNLISGNNEGILLYGPIINNITHFSDGNKILGNIIGLSINGTDDLGNVTNGIRIDNRSRNNILGGANKGERNFISGNGGNGVTIAGPFTRLNHVIGNYIGTDITGKVAVPNVGGVNIVGEAYSNYIGGPSSGLGNLIANNTDVGIWLMSDSTYVEGNEIYGHSVDAIFIAGNHNVIGGSETGKRNFIYSNNNGIRTDSHATFNRIVGNYLGTDRTGRIDQTEGYSGVSLSGSDNTVLNNLISGYNNGHGIYIQRWDLSSPIPERNSIEANVIGLDATGTEFIPNQHGISINTAVNTKIIKNKIAGNQYYGIVIADNFFQESDIYHSSVGTLISENSIYNNGLIGINLNLDDVTPNDSIYNEATGKYDYDYDLGPNNLQNYPVIDSLNYTSSSVYIKGHLYSQADSSYTLEFFASKVVDNTGYGEGRTYLGSAKVMTNSSGKAYFSETFSRSSGWGDVITATATDASGNTSEFSMALGGLKDQIIATADWPFHFKMNEEGIPRITDGSDTAAVGKSFRTWENITTAIIDFVNDRTTTIKNASATDGINLVSFTDEKYPFPPRVLAIAAKTLKVSPNDDVAYIIDADIVVNPKFVQHNVGVGYENTNAGYYDAQSIITHEIGHVLGLIHTGVVNSTMFFMLDSGTSVRSLEQDDRSWASYKYPRIPDYNDTFGSISGRITYGEDPTLPPVAGALVFAINTLSNDTIHAYSDADGNYLVPGLPEGSYNIYIQPLDGDVYGYNLRPGNISTYIYCNTIYTDYPGEYLSYDESNEEGEETLVSVGVPAGVTTTVSDIITNKDLTPPTLLSVRPTDVLDDRIKVMSDFFIRFSEPVDKKTLTDETCYLELGEPDNKQFGGTFTILPDSINIVVFNPDSVLRFNRLYTLHLTAGIKDLKGNDLIEPSPVSFTTVERDTEPPVITSTSPVNEADSVYVITDIKVSFSEPMDIESVNDNFALTWEEGTPAVTNIVEGSISWDNERRKLTFTPSRSLNEDTEYTITISSEATDLSANHLATDNTFEFVTVEEAAPVIIYLGPKDEQSDVTVETPVVADFSEPVDPSTVNTSTFILRVANEQTPITGTFEFLNEDARVVFRPETNLLPNTEYAILLTTGIKDISENVRSMEADYGSEFTTAAAPVAPEITYLDPSNGKAGNVVTIAGTGFDPYPDRNLISFNGITAYAKTASLNTLTTKVPIGTLSGPVTVTVKNRTSNEMNFNIIPEYENDPIDYVISNKSLGSSSSGGADISGDGEAVFAMVTNPDGNFVTRIGLGSEAGDIIKIPVGLYPQRVDIDQQGNRAYVTNSASHDVSVIDLSKNTVVKTISVGIEPFGVVVTPDGKRVYVSNYSSGDLSLIDVDPTSGGFDHVVSNVPIGTDPTELAVTGDAGMILVVGDFGLKIVNSDPKDENYNSVTANVSSGTTYSDVDVTGDAGFAIVSTIDGSLLIINLHPENDDYSGAIIANAPTGSNNPNVEMDANGIYVYVTDTENDQIMVYKFSEGGTGSSSGSSASDITLIPLTSIHVGDSPEGLVISPAGYKVYTITGSTDRSVTTISFTGGIISPEQSIEGLIATIQSMVNSGTISPTTADDLINKLNDFLSLLYAGKTKTAINELGAFINKVENRIKHKLIPEEQGNAMIAVANAVIARLKSTKSEGEEFYFTDIETQSDMNVTTETKLGVIYPNPFSESVTINYEVAESIRNHDKVLIRVYDISGRLVGTLVDKTMQPGRYTTIWSGRYDQGVPAPYGTYFVLFRAGKVREVREIMLIR